MTGMCTVASGKKYAMKLLSTSGNKVSENTNNVTFRVKVKTFVDVAKRDKKHTSVYN